MPRREELLVDTLAICSAVWWQWVWSAARLQLAAVQGEKPREAERD